MHDLENIPISFFTVRDKNLISLFLYGDDKFDDAKNRKILMSTIRFIKDSQKLDEERYQLSYAYAVIFVFVLLKVLFYPLKELVLHVILLLISSSLVFWKVFLLEEQYLHITLNCQKKVIGKSLRGRHNF